MCSDSNHPRSLPPLPGVTAEQGGVGEEDEVEGAKEAGCEKSTKATCSHDCRVSITRVQEEVVQIEGESIESENYQSCRKFCGFNFYSYLHLIHPGEIILDDLSFDILEALKNVDEVNEEENTSSKRRKTHNSFTNRTREVMMDEDSEKEYSPPKVRFLALNTPPSVSWG